MSAEAGAFSVTVTGIPLWLLREYLEELGGARRTDHLLAGAGWEVELTQEEDFQLGSLRVGRVRLEARGEPGAVAALERALQPKLQRAGG